MLRQIYGYAGGYGMRTLPWNSAGGKWVESALEFLAKVRVAKLARRLLQWFTGIHVWTSGGGTCVLLLSEE